MEPRWWPWQEGEQRGVAWDKGGVLSQLPLKRPRPRCKPGEPLTPEALQVWRLPVGPPWPGEPVAEVGGTLLLQGCRSQSPPKGPAFLSGALKRTGTKVTPSSKGLLSASLPHSPTQPTPAACPLCRAFSKGESWCLEPEPWSLNPEQVSKMGTTASGNKDLGGSQKL